MYDALNELNRTHQSDKGFTTHAFHGRNYLHVYDMLLSQRANKIKTLLEIGVLNGNSLRLWRDYFPLARIVGIDIDPNAARHAWNGIEIMIGDQSDPNFLNKVCKCLGSIDVVVDDGSHVTEHMLTSFRHLWPIVSNLGLYCFEDTRCTYEKLDDDGVRKIWPGMGYNDKNKSLNNDRKVMDHFLSSLIGEMDHLNGDVSGVHVYPMQIVVEKVWE